MVRYKNLSGSSGVLGYETGSDRIRVYFKDGSDYLYTYNSAGSYNIEHMKKLAAAGSGLNTFINTTVKYKYEKR